MTRLPIVILLTLGLSVTAWAAAEKPIPSLIRLPAGHPEISNRAASTQPAITGKLTVHAVQGTKGGPTIAGDPVVIELYQAKTGQMFKRIETKLDAQGAVVVEDLPVALGFQPRVSVRHGGAEYVVAGEAMDGVRADGKVDVTVYESTDQAPAWQVPMRHVIVHRVPEGLHVTEMLSINNPADHAWLGTAGADGVRTTLTLPLPAGAGKLEIGGSLDDATVEYHDGKLVSAAPLLPGGSQIHFAYVLAPKNGEVRLPISAPAPVQQLMVFLPDDGTTVTTEGLISAGPWTVEQKQMRYYKAMNAPAGQLANIVIQGIAPMAEAPSLTPASRVPQIIAAVGGGLVLVIGAVIVLTRSGKPAKAKG